MIHGATTSISKSIYRTQYNNSHDRGNYSSFNTAVLARSLASVPESYLVVLFVGFTRGRRGILRAGQPAKPETKKYMLPPGISYRIQPSLGAVRSIVFEGAVALWGSFVDDEAYSEPASQRSLEKRKKDMLKRGTLHGMYEYVCMYVVYLLSQRSDTAFIKAFWGNLGMPLALLVSGVGRTSAAIKMPPLTYFTRLRMGILLVEARLSESTTITKICARQTRVDWERAVAS